MKLYDINLEQYDSFYREVLDYVSANPERKLKAILIEDSEAEKVPNPPERQTAAETQVPLPIVKPTLPYKEQREPAYLDLRPLDFISHRYAEEARLFGQFCSAVQTRLNACDSRTAEWKLITYDYNNKVLVPKLYEIVGKRNERALRGWLERFIANEQDMYAMLHKGKNKNRGRKVTYLEQSFLLSKLLGPNNIKVGSAIQSLKAAARLGLCESPASLPTLKRWCTDWIAEHPAEWAQARKGSKYVSENIIKTILRDDSVLKVGSVWVADGHTLAFDVISPKTGKPVRMTLIMVMDWASRYPVGASLAVTEDSQHILTAFRNGFLNWGALPEYVYLDNGKAFKAKLFHDNWDKHDLEKELAGIFPRLNIGVAFAESYNAKAKVIERFFKTLQEQLERFISTFRGSNVADKPATLMRNEKWMQKMFQGEAPTVEEAMQLIAFYVRHIYGETPHTGLGGRTPWQVFSSSQLPQDRLVEPSRLNFLMLTAERKNIRNQGINLDGKLYWDAALIDYIGQPVIIRYDYNDARWILVYDKTDHFICQAAIRRTQHAFIHLSMDQPVAHKELNQELNQIRKLKREKATNTKSFIRQSQETVDRQVKPLPIKTDQLPLFVNQPLIQAPEPKPEDEIERLGQKLLAESQTEDEQPPINTMTTINEDTDQTEQSDSLVATHSFQEMLKIIGLD
jgi:putative transposase